MLCLCVAIKRERMLKKIFLFAAILNICSFHCFGTVTDENITQMAESYYSAVKSACSGISDSVSKISGVAKSNTVVNSIGTVASGGALAMGIAKERVDSDIEKLMEDLCEIGGCDAEKITNMTDEEIPHLAETLAKIKKLNDDIEREQKQSKKLGNWRTGLMAGNVVTNVVSAVLAGVNKDKSELIQQIQACNQAVKGSADIKRKLQQAGINPIDNPIVGKLNTISSWCGNLDVSNVEKIEKQMGAVMGVSIAGAAVGAAGVATSAAANSDNENDNKKSLNTAANVLSGVGVATGVVGVGLNISMINTAKSIIKQSEGCEEVLK